METKTKRIYPATQLIVALDPMVLKTYMWILSWSTQGSVKYYEKQFAKACKMDKEIIERCIQTLVNAKLVDVSVIDQTFMLTPSVEQNQKYYQIPISKVLEGQGIPMAQKVTWNVTKTEKKAEAPTIEDMNEQEIQSMILRLQASLNEKRQMKELVKVASAPIEDPIIDDLPF